jgi:hypothetical protein
MNIDSAAQIAFGMMIGSLSSSTPYQIHRPNPMISNTHIAAERSLVSRVLKTFHACGTNAVTQTAAAM